MRLLENLIIEKTDDNKYQLVINHVEHGKFILNDTLYETEQDAIQAKYIAEKRAIERIIGVNHRCYHVTGNGAEFLPQTLL